MRDYNEIFKGALVISANVKYRRALAMAFIKCQVKPKFTALDATSQDLPPDNHNWDGTDLIVLDISDDKQRLKDWFLSFPNRDELPPVIVTDRNATVDDAGELYRAGAADYIMLANLRRRRLLTSLGYVEDFMSSRLNGSTATAVLAEAVDEIKIETAPEPEAVTDVEISEAPVEMSAEAVTMPSPVLGTAEESAVATDDVDPLDISRANISLDDELMISANFRALPDMEEFEALVEEGKQQAEQLPDSVTVPLNQKPAAEAQNEEAETDDVDPMDISRANISLDDELMISANYRALPDLDEIKEMTSHSDHAAVEQPTDVEPSGEAESLTVAIPNLGESQPAVEATMEPEQAPSIEVEPEPVSEAAPAPEPELSLESEPAVTPEPEAKSNEPKVLDISNEVPQDILDFELELSQKQEKLTASENEDDPNYNDFVSTSIVNILERGKEKVQEEQQAAAEASPHAESYERDDFLNTGLMSLLERNDVLMKEGKPSPSSVLPFKMDDIAKQTAKVGEYQINEHIATGSTSSVFRVTHEPTGEVYAMKVLIAEQEDNMGRDRFMRGYELLKSLGHSNIVNIKELVEDPKTCYAVIEYFPAGDLQRVLDQNEKFTIEQALLITARIAAGLSHAHGKDVLHRDLKPSNIMFRDDGTLALTDFGIAKSARPSADTNLTMTGTVMGTSYYVSPEQIAGRDADARSDLYALGAILFELIEGRHAFEGGNEMEIMAAHASEETPKLSAENEKLQPIINNMIAKDPMDRYLSVREFIAAVRDMYPKLIDDSIMAI